MPTALITGASSGLGEQFAYTLGREHYDLVITARREDRLNHVAEQARKLGAGAVTIIPADLSQRAAAGEIWRQIESARIEIDYLINNAGFGTAGRFDRLKLERELEEIDLNVTALVALTRLLVPAMVARGRGKIINLASTAAFQPLPYMATYAATKAFVLSFSEALAGELAGTGVQVTAVCPGPVRTEFQAIARNERQRLPEVMYTDPERVVAQGLAAAASGRAVCIPGLINSTMARLTRFAPRSLVTAVARTINRQLGSQSD